MSRSASQVDTWFRSHRRRGRPRKPYRHTVVLVGHGSHLDPNSSPPIHAVADALRDAARYDEVRVGFWKEEPSLSRALDGTWADEVTVVPMFISDGYFAKEVVPREMGLAGRVTKRDEMCIRYTEPVGSHPALADVVVARAQEVGADSDASLVVLGHGTPRNPTSEVNVFKHADEIRRRGLFREVVALFMDQEPNMRELFERTSSPAVVVVPLFMASGWHVGQTIPAELALDGPETRAGGRRLLYSEPVGTHPEMHAVVQQLIGDAEPLPGPPFKRHRDAPPPPQLKPVPRKLDWESFVPEWTVFRQEGEIEVSYRVDLDAEAVRGPRDDGAGTTRFECTPGELRQWVRFEDSGRYRPLSGARTMRRNWEARVFQLHASPGGVHDRVSAEDAVYPTGQRLPPHAPPVPLEDVLARQTGRYAVAQQLDPTGRDAAAEVLCGQCVRKPSWRGDYPAWGELPCPEPCSVMVSLCREAALWQDGPPKRTTPDPRAPFAAFDEPGNEIREAYLEKRYGDG